MAVRRHFCVAVAGLVLITGVAACGGSGTPKPQGNGDAASRLATTIKARLTAAGYKPGSPSALIGDPNHPPIPEQAFTVKGDPNTTDSFTVTVLVFHSAKDATLFNQHNATACKALSSCRKALKTNYGQGRKRTYGSVIYGGSSDSGTSVVPLAEFKKIIALARGSASN